MKAMTVIKTEKKKNRLNEENFQTSTCQKKFPKQNEKTKEKLSRKIFVTFSKCEYRVICTN